MNQSMNGLMNRVYLEWLNHCKKSLIENLRVTLIPFRNMYNYQWTWGTVIFICLQNFYTDSPLHRHQILLHQNHLHCSKSSSQYFYSSTKENLQVEFFFNNFSQDINTRSPRNNHKFSLKHINFI